MLRAISVCCWSVASGGCYCIDAAIISRPDESVSPCRPGASGGLGEDPVYISCIHTSVAFLFYSGFCAKVLGRVYTESFDLAFTTGEDV